MATRKKYKIVLSEKYVHKSENGKEWFQFPVNISGQLVAIQTIIPLDPYTEPDMEQVRKEGYQQGYEQGYKDGYNEPGKGKIQVGDEVFYGNTKGIVIRPEDSNRYASVFTAIGEHISAENKDLTKTGRHFPEIAEVLAKMKETDDG